MVEDDDLEIDDDIIEATVVPTAEDQARTAVNAVLREESVDITTKFMAHVKNRLKLTDMAFQNIQAIQQDLMLPENYATMTTQEKLKFLQVLTNQMSILEVPMEEQKITVNQINTQINNALNADKAVIALPRASRNKLRETLMELAKGMLPDGDKQSDDTGKTE